MAKITTLLIDKGGVLVDNDELSERYRALLGRFLPTRLGATPDGWANANANAFERQLERWKAAAATGAGPTNIREWFRNDARVWLYDMCDGVGVARPPGSAADEIASDALRFVRENLTFHIPLVVDRLRELRRRRIILHIASGDAHDDLVQYLEAMGIRKLFGRVYGSDLVNVWKTSAAYYRAILAETGTDPTTALVIDDSERAIGWAAECGLRGVLVRRQARESFEDSVLRAFDEVNALL